MLLRLQLSHKDRAVKSERSVDLTRVRSVEHVDGLDRDDAVGRRLERGMVSRGAVEHADKTSVPLAVNAEGRPGTHVLTVDHAATPRASTTATGITATGG